ncbi:MULTISPECIES: ScbA/BarX family gamma-butyrolactone biosynthesis protein [unclassified Streptomyces]|uniref:ScbA/BarX family gamma-butyrolactone biosynthesis protein n=1 Tax=unclassified Streptomyces TaxID=2593676 RepID=UPI0009A118C6|nr:ScbA/BarX family gamma-butyrolactone biosynthesis protein [Streptomyces sp. SAT1]
MGSGRSSHAPRASDGPQGRGAGETCLTPSSWSRTVPRELVHRVSVAEVLLTDVRPCGRLAFCAAALWPRSHPTFPRGHDSRHSPWLVVETVRQLGIYIPRCHFGVPAAARFLIDDVSYRIDPDREPRAPHGGSEITCRVTVTGLTGAPGSDHPRRMRLRADFRSGGQVFARADGGARFLTAERYATVRTVSAGPPPRAATARPRPQPALLGVPAEADALVALDGGTLVVDPADLRHPFLFDHETDHVPGMALLEAARQAVALRSAGRLVRPLGGRMTASHFTEHAPPAAVESTAYGRTAVFRFRQGGVVTAGGVLRYQ